MYAELMAIGIDFFNLDKRGVPVAAKGFYIEVDGLAYDGWTVWLNRFYLHTGPVAIAFPLYEILPDHLDRGCDDRGGTDC